MDIVGTVERTIVWVYDTLWYSTPAEKLIVLVTFFGLFTYWALLNISMDTGVRKRTLLARMVRRGCFRKS